MRIAVIGRHGQVARALGERATAHAGLDLVFIGRPELDLVRPDGLIGLLERARPDLVINPAAYTAVDRAEADAETAFAVNRDGARAVAAAAAQIDVPLIHLSTDYVFDGTSERAYREDDPVAPISIYGRSKLAGEQAVAEVQARHLIVRTAWIYSPFGSNFVRTMLRLAQERPHLRVVDDQWGSPTYAPDLADALLSLAERLAGPAWNAANAGRYHLAAGPAMTWCRFARAILEVSARHGGPSVPVEAITTADYPTPAHRPANSRLDCTAIAERFAIRLPDVTSGIERCVPRILAGAAEGRTIGAER
jgi:dTDP-4-dehydrorhamnose reductase